MKKFEIVMFLLVFVSCGDVQQDEFFEEAEAKCDDDKDNDNDTLLDCEDPDCGCIDADGDGYYARPQGDDCDDDPSDDIEGCEEGKFCAADIHPDAEEVCGDKVDQNCDTVDEQCVPEEKEDECDDGIDNDGDTLIDCRDPDCEEDDACKDVECIPGRHRDCGPDTEVGICKLGTQYCGEDEKWGDCIDAVIPADEVCDDNLDNDCDGDTDSEDADCDPSGVCTPGEYRDCGPDTEVGICKLGTQHCNEDSQWNGCLGAVEPEDEDCNNGLDDDCDGDTDSEDADCDPSGVCTPGEYRDCGDTDVGICEYGTQYCDDDGFWGNCLGAVEPEDEDCDNGLDDDCDGYTDSEDAECEDPGDLYTFYIHAELTTGERTDVFVATGTIWNAGLGTTGIYHSDSTGLSDTSGHSCRYTDGRSSFTCELRLPCSADFSNINFYYSLESDGSFWGCRWDHGAGPDVLSPILDWYIEYPDGHTMSKSSLGDDHGRNYNNNGCDWRSDHD